MYNYNLAHYHHKRVGLVLFQSYSFNGKALCAQFAIKVRTVDICPGCKGHSPLGSISTDYQQKGLILSSIPC